MFKDDILKAIYDKYLYEYFVVDSDFQILHYSDRVIEYCEVDCIDGENSNIFNIIPEIFGMEDELMEIFDDRKEHILLPSVFKAPDHYVDISIKKGSSETLIILFENVTKTIEYQRQLQQDRNENIMLSKELIKKNAQLEVYNREMDRLVQEEIAKNIENQKLIRLQARHAQMGELIGMITHQWKQPLSIININSGYLKMRYSDEIEDKDIFVSKIENILNQSRYLNQTIIDFQNFFNPNEKKKIFNLKDVIEKTLSLVSSDYINKNISITIDEKSSADILGYENEYSQVVLSILQNSREALLLHPNKNMYISISIETKDKKSILKIKDNAGGIPESIIDSIFNAYMTTKESGSGLGLHISKSIIEKKMNGTIAVQNLDEGAEFTIIV
ncbi:histidine kinase [hydrothermal vent metagenome]|uniref:Histidine kinase n=1 Tax=hydrothermal vent metagenome TaxID=652676 RepID=A0A1W1CAT9_9ZZZZ